MFTRLMDNASLKGEPGEVIDCRRLNDGDTVLIEHGDDCITNSSEVCIARPEVRVRLVHRDVLALSLSLHQSG